MTPLLKAAVVIGLVVGVGWIIGLAALVLWAIQAALKFRRLRRALAETMWCENNHPNPAYGRFRCTICGAAWDGWIWAPCRVCGASCGWSACVVCKCALRNPVEH